MEWEIKQGLLVKEFEFENFKKAIEFVNSLALIAENNHHHPDIFIHSYNKVKISLFTHSENKVTDKDYILAKEIDSINKK